MRLLNVKKEAVQQLLLMLSMLLMPHMLRNLGLMSITYWFLSPMPASIPRMTDLGKK